MLKFSRRVPPFLSPYLTTQSLVVENDMLSPQVYSRPQVKSSVFAGVHISVEDRRYNGKKKKMWKRQVLSGRKELLWNRSVGRKWFFIEFLNPSQSINQSIDTHSIVKTSVCLFHTLHLLFMYKMSQHFLFFIFFYHHPPPSQTLFHSSVDLPTLLIKNIFLLFGK